MVDALALILDLAKRAGHIRGICPHLVANGGLTHLQYAYDTIMMVEGSDEDIQNLKFLLLCFQELSGLTINFAKSEVMVLGYSQAEAQRIANRLNCRLGSFPTTYLGKTISDTCLLEKDFHLIVAKLKARMEYAKFLQDIVNEMTKEVKFTRSGENKQKAEDIEQFIKKVLDFPICLLHCCSA